MNDIATKLVAILPVRFPHQQNRNQFCRDILTISYGNIILGPHEQNHMDGFPAFKKYVQAIYHDGAFYLMGGFKTIIQTEVWKSSLEKKLLPNEHNFNRYSFSILSTPKN